MASLNLAMDYFQYIVYQNKIKSNEMDHNINY